MEKLLQIRTLLSELKSKTEEHIKDEIKKNEEIKKSFELQKSFRDNKNKDAMEELDKRKKAHNELSNKILRNINGKK